MSWFTKKELITCAACKGTGRQPAQQAGWEGMKGNARDVVKMAQQFFMLTQGICLGCYGAGKVRR